MASSESQGLTIALIILLILTILLAVMTFLFFTQYQETSTKLDEMTKKATESDRAQREMQSEINRMKELMGISTDAKLAEAEAAWEDDMKQYAATVPDDQRDYREALKFLSGALDQSNDQLVAAQAEIAALKQSNTAFEAAKQKELEQFQAQAQQAAQELAQERAKFNDAIAAKNQENQTLLAQFEEGNRKLQEEIQALQKQIGTAQQEVATLQTVNTSQGQKLAVIQGHTAQSYDGEIRWVNTRGGLVWINVGRADGLQPMTTFEVQTKDLPAGGSTPSKGKIEVTKLLGDHLAEARILNDKLTDPIVPGDGIFTSLWDPGQKLQFAIAGRIYLDGDQTDDIDRLRDLIAVAGGKVDAVLSTSGQVEGEMTVNTRYLILGSPQEAYRAAYDEMVANADRMGVQRITAQAFLDQIGWKGDTGQLIRYGRESNAGEIPPEGAAEFQPRDARTKVQEQFQERRPPAALPAPAGAP